MASELVYLRDLDGTGSMHIYASGDDGAIAYAPASTRPAPEYAGLVERLLEQEEFNFVCLRYVNRDGREAATALTDLSQRNKALEAEVERLRGLLEAIKADCQSTIDLYERNGPSFTSQATGDEYEPASFVQNKMHELLNIAALGDHP